MNKLSNRKLFFGVIKQALQWGKLSYISFMIIGALISFEIFFWLRLPQVTSDVIYTLFSEEVSDFLNEIMPVITVLIILLVFQIARNIYAVIGVKIRRNAQTHFELNLIQKTSFLPWEEYENHEFKSKLDMVNRQGLVAYQNISIDFFEYIISTIVYVAVYVKVITELGLITGLIFLLLTIIYFVTGIYFGAKYYEVVNKNRGQNFRMWFMFRLGRNKEIHQDLLVNRGNRYIMKEWSTEHKSYMNKVIKSRTQMKLFLILPNIIFSILSGWLIYTVIIDVSNGIYTIGYFTLIITTIINYKRTLEGFAYRSQWYKNYFQTYRDYLTLIGKENEIPNNEKKLKENFEISFDDVTYKYVQSDYKALNRLKLSIKDKETIAIVGVNGSGKTTFVNLMGELTKRYDGRVLINDKNIKEELGTLRNSTAIIFQNFQEYQLTIKENIQLGDIQREISDDEIIDILKKVQLYKDVEKLPNGINTMLGQLEDGTELSKGQWQRLAVARLLAKKDAKIWILDEPTAYLDPIAEIEMYKFIYTLKEDRAVIFISHRLGFAKMADRIIVFKDGEVVEKGHHKELMKHNQEYAKMFEKQKGWYT